MGLDIYLEWTGMTEAEQKSRFTGFQNSGANGYLRSSYNDGGFDSWCNRMLGKPGFYYIFGYDGDADDEEGHFHPDWDAAEQRTLELITMADALPADKLTTMRVPPRVADHEHLTEQNVLDYYRKLTAKPSAFECFSNWAGLWSPAKPLKVKAILWVAGRFTQGPEPMLIVESDEDPNAYYRECLKHTLEFIKAGRERSAWVVWSS